MKKIIFTLLFFIFSVGYAEGLWEKYLNRMENFNVPEIDEKVLLDLLKNKYSSEAIENSKNIYIEKGLDDSEIIIRKSCIIYVGNNKLTHLAKKIVQKIADVEDKNEKKLLVWAFGEIGTSQDVLAVVEYLRNEQDKYILNLVVVAVSKISKKDGSITPLLILAENSSNLYIKSTAILGLGKVGDKRSAKLLWDFAVSSQYPKEIHYCSIIALSSVLEHDSDKEHKVQQLKDMFYATESIYEKLALSFTVQKLSGYDVGYYNYMVGFLKKPYFNEVAMDLMENLPFRQGKDRLEIVMINFPQGMMKDRINQLVMKLKRLR